MKTPTSRTRRMSAGAGFTLIELLVVMAIIAILAALTLSAFSFAQQAASKNKTTGTMAAIKAALESYKEKFGEYPAPVRKEYSATFSSGSADSGRGAQMLYQAMTGDGNDAIVIATGGGQQSNGEIDSEEKVNTITGLLPPSQVYKASVNEYYLVDGFGRPFQYSKYPPESAVDKSQYETDTVNETSYDLWSFGTYDSASRSAASPEVNLTTKKNEAATATWLKNW